MLTFFSNCTRTLTATLWISKERKSIALNLGRLPRAYFFSFIHFPVLLHNTIILNCSPTATESIYQVKNSIRATKLHHPFRYLCLTTYIHSHAGWVSSEHCAEKERKQFWRSHCRGSGTAEENFIFGVKATSRLKILIVILKTTVSW